MVKVNAGLSQNPLDHSFISAALSNESQKLFLMRKHARAAGRHGKLESAKRGWNRKTPCECWGKML